MRSMLRVSGLLAVCALAIAGVRGCGGGTSASVAKRPEGQAPKRGQVHNSLNEKRTPDLFPGATPREAQPPETAAALSDEAARRVCGAAVPLPRDVHYVTPGLAACWVGRVDGGLRQIAFAPNGDLFGTTSAGTIYRFRDVDHDGRFSPGPPETVTWASTGGNGNSSHIDAAGGYLYAGAPDGVSRWKWSPEIDAGGAGEPVVIEEPGGGGHGRHTCHVYDGFLYVQLGSEGNAVDPMSPEYDTRRSLVKRFDLSKLDPAQPFRWDDGEPFSVGLRNTVGFTRNAAGRMYGVVNGLDNVTWNDRDVHNENPGEQIVALEKGKRFGYPFCYTAQRLVKDDRVVLAGTQVKSEIFPSPHDDAWCAMNSDKPTTFIQAHSAPLSIEFFDGPVGRLPARWKGGAFVALHGSWDRQPPTGYKVVWVPFAPDGTAPMPVSDADGTQFPYEVVLGGGRTGHHVDGPWGWGVGDQAEPVVRPVGVAVSPIDGSLYVSSDAGSMLYRVASP